MTVSYNLLSPTTIIIYKLNVIRMSITEIQSFCWVVYSHAIGPVQFGVDYLYASRSIQACPLDTRILTPVSPKQIASTGSSETVKITLDILNMHYKIIVIIFNVFYHLLHHNYHALGIMHSYPSVGSTTMPLGLETFFDTSTILLVPSALATSTVSRI